MTDNICEDEPQQASDAHERRHSLLSRHPRLGILLIAGVFYIILCGMVMTVLVLILRG